MDFPIVVLLLVLVLTAVRRFGRWRLRIWQIMAGGACAVLVAGSISPAAALRAIDLDVMLYLFGVFVVGRALEASGYLFHLGYRLLRGVRSDDRLLLALLFGVGAASALLMNDTLAIIGAPLVLTLARQHALDPKALLLVLAFAVTLGSVLSPIGNPQNLLIAIHAGLPAPFLTFLRHLAVPTVINLLLTYWLVRRCFPGSFQGRRLAHRRMPVEDKSLARLARAALGTLAALVGAKIALAAAAVELPLTWIALAAAAPILALSPRRMEIVRTLDWRTLAFFAAMFVLMDSVWATGLLQRAVDGAGLDVSAVGAVLGVSVVLSQLISNVPLVALYLPVLTERGAGPEALMALAAGSTIAGNLFILGAASNVIVIQNAERLGGPSVSFVEFARIGVPLTVLNGVVYALFLSWA